VVTPLLGIIAPVLINLQMRRPDILHGNRCRGAAVLQGVTINWLAGDAHAALKVATGCCEKV
jgi:hypothetical protein